MFSENFMRYLIAYQSEDMKPDEKQSVQKTVKRPLMVDLIGAKYAAVPIKNSSK